MTGSVGKHVARRQPDVEKVAGVFAAAESPVLCAVATWLADVAAHWDEVGRTEQTFAANVAAAALTGTTTTTTTATDPSGGTPCPTP